MQTYNSALSQEFKRLLEAEIRSLSEALSAGALSTFEEYKYYAGKIAGLRDAADLIDEAVAILDGKQRSN